MVQNNKVLTVSYGTFSCTLEGFEDSFGTMKAIAEYFRDLASDDRYFGAEPPQPDADMLARIAQREIARQVEARTSNAGIHLRAASETTSDAPAVAPVAETPVADVTAADTPVAEAKVETAPVETAKIEAPQTQPAAETVTAPAKAATSAALAEPETLEAEQPAPVSEDTAASIEQPLEEEVSAEVPSETAQDDAQEETAAAAVESNYPIIADSTVEFFDADSAAADSAQVNEEAAEEEETPEEDDNLDFAEGALEEADADTIETETAEVEASEPDEVQEPEIDLDQIAAVVAETADTQPEAAEVLPAETVEVAEKPKPAANSIAAKLQRIRAVVSRTPADEFSEDQHAEALKTKSDDLSAALESEPADEEGLDNDDLIERALQELKADKAATEDVATVSEDAPKQNAPAAESAPETKPRRSRVIRVRRSAVAEPAAQKAAAQKTAAPASSLSADDEDDLRQELAAVEAELLAATGTKETSAPEAPKLPGSDVSRLMAAADEKLDDPDAAASREAYGHMRAAVSAAQGDKNDDAEDASADYRKDLASAVQPRRPVVRRRSERPAAAQNQPLKLVAEQRIDEPKPAEAKVVAKSTVRPRRVTTSMKPAAPETSDSNFAKYAHDTGAVELHEMLEAAASYLSFVKGQDVFSRPELINKVRATGTEFNREDSMRSFGRLLRDGKIARRQNGRFAASEEIGFQPQGRAAG
ncbi:hypothetical protein GG681_12085 [Epibacterium sp. SM1969]|uniref:Lipoprotein n=1 Tax=Tritonibacter aquimaris TaxID=2663379 RepID=A0A844AYG4_9RHOB|nr:hypothetical protein [Tritonibacter aquimaris]MQY43384.1 hypothetical protein [Tritonibacter aquimaris]